MICVRGANVFFENVSNIFVNCKNILAKCVKWLSNAYQALDTFHMLYQDKIIVLVIVVRCIEMYYKLLEDLLY